MSNDSHDSTTAETNSAAGKPRGLLGALGAVLRWSAPAVLLAGLLLRLTIRDQVHALAWLFYATPPAAMTALGLAGLLAWLRGRPGWGVVITAGLTVACGVLVARMVHWNDPPAADPAPGTSVKLLLWNAARGDFGTQGVLEKLREADADVIGLVEAPLDPQIDWTKELPGYAVSDIDDGILLAVRGRIRNIAHWRYDEGSSRRRFDVEVHGRRLWVLLVDLRSSLHRSREVAMGKLLQDAKVLADRPAVIAGDFNLPSDSAWFQPLREHWTEAFVMAGRGWAGTWPSPLTVMDLDQVWVNRHLRVSHCRILKTLRSDHAAVQVRLELPGEAPKKGPWLQQQAAP